MKFILLIAVTLTLALSALGQQSLAIGATAPVFSASALNGNTIDLESQRGHVVVITFWSTRCEICRAEIPRLNQFVKEYANKDVSFIAPTMENDTRLTPFLRNNPFDFLIVPQGLDLLLKYADRDKEGNLDMGYPAFFVINKSGNVGYRASGYDKTKQIASAIDRMLAE